MKNKLRFKEAKAHMLQKMEQTASQVGVFVESESKARTPVDTGHLRRSISHESNITPQKGSVFVGTNVEYAPYIEYGTINQNAQPFIKPSISENVSTLQSIINKGMKV